MQLSQYTTSREKWIVKLLEKDIFKVIILKKS